MSGLRKLIVCDDEPDFRSFIRHYAESIGYEVCEVTESATCVTDVVAFQPEVVILDVMMPEPDGIEIVHALARAGYKGRVVLTSGSHPQFLKAASVVGTLEGLTIRELPKPASIADLEHELVGLAEK